MMSADELTHILPTGNVEDLHGQPPPILTVVNSALNFLVRDAGCIQGDSAPAWAHCRRRIHPGESTVKLLRIAGRELAGHPR